jgi:hypothetical protein
VDIQNFLTTVGGVYDGAVPVLDAVVSNLTATPNVGTGAIDLAWDSSAQFTGGTVRIERKSSGSFTELTFQNDGIFTYSDDEGVSSTQYTYRVRQLAQGVYSNYSNNATATYP